MSKQTVQLILFLIMSTLITGVGLAEPAFRAFTVKVLVQDAREKKPVPGVLVELKRGGTTIRSDTTDRFGQCSFMMSSDPSITSVTLSHDQYLPANIRPIFVRQDEPLVLPVPLSKGGVAKLSVAEAAEALASLLYFKAYPDGHASQISQLEKALSEEVLPDEVYSGLLDQRLAVLVDTRIKGLEHRVETSEQNSKRVSGQIDELVGISSAVREPGRTAKAAQETADAAVAAVNATNERVLALDDYVEQTSIRLFFTAKQIEMKGPDKEMDGIGSATSDVRGFLIEIVGYSNEVADEAVNIELSQKRAEAVARYLVRWHNIPLRRFTFPIGLGSSKPCSALPGGQQSAGCVEVRLIVNRGLNQNVEVRSTTMNDQED